MASRHPSTEAAVADAAANSDVRAAAGAKNEAAPQGAGGPADKRGRYLVTARRSG